MAGIRVVPRRSMILDQYGRPYVHSSGQSSTGRVQAKYDAAQTWVGNEKHWANADHLDPHAAASYSVRRTLRTRSRYEILENNPYLKGTLLTIANDFVGRGVRLQVTDKRISKDRRRQIELRYAAWMSRTKFRQKLWRMRMAKLVDGEAFLRAYVDRRLLGPLKLNFQVLECDRISSQSDPVDSSGEIDGVRFNAFEEPTAYHILNDHPGGNLLYRALSSQAEGQWVDAEYVIHWYRKDRSWLRGLPELTPSLPLCAVLRRYTLSKLRHSETASDLTLIVETEGPASNSIWSEDAVDTPFATMPFEQGLINVMPWGYKSKQLSAVPPGEDYDEYVGSLLRETVRPALTPYNIAAGTSKDSNMASAIVDRDIYRGGQRAERTHCEEEVCDKALALWWYEAIRIPNYLGDDLLASEPMFRDEPPEHGWGWDAINSDHTDPVKVANALRIAHDKRFLTDRDIQETYYNRDVETWRQEIVEDDVFRATLLAMGFNVPEMANDPAHDLDEFMDREEMDGK